MRTGVYCGISGNEWSKVSNEIQVTFYEGLETVFVYYVLFVVLFGTYFNVTVCTEGNFVMLLLLLLLLRRWRTGCSRIPPPPHRPQRSAF